MECGHKQLYEQLVYKAENSVIRSKELRYKADKLFKKAQDVRDQTGDPKKYRWRFNKANHYYDVANLCESKAKALYAEAATL